MATSSFGKFEKVLRIGEGRRLKRLAEQAAYITSLEPDFEDLTDAELLAKSVEFKERIANGSAPRGTIGERGRCAHGCSSCS